MAEEPTQKSSFERLWDDIRDAAGKLFTHSVSFRKDGGPEAFALPLVVAVLLLVIATHVSVILLILALVAGYRLSIRR